MVSSVFWIIDATSISGDILLLYLSDKVVNGFNRLIGNVCFCRFLYVF